MILSSSGVARGVFSTLRGSGMVGAGAGGGGQIELKLGVFGWLGVKGQR